MLRRVVIAGVMVLLLGVRLVAQGAGGPPVPEIGAKIHDFRFDDVKYFSRTAASVSDFKGKFLILDFFTTGCAACFESLPKINTLASEFKDNVQIMMVGLDERNLRGLYERHQTKLGLQLPVAYVKRELWSQFQIFGVPHVLIIDPTGVVRAITHTFSKSDIELFVAGKDPQLLRKLSSQEQENMEEKYTWQKPLLLNGNGAPDSVVVFRSMLTQWSGNIYSMFNPDYMRDMNKIAEGADKAVSRFEVIGYDLKKLYRIAYGDTLSSSFGPVENAYGKFWPQPILEVRDSSDFISKSNSARNMYNYSLIVPRRKNSALFMQQIMQRDLLAYFGFNAVVEERLMPCWNLVATDKAKKELKSNGSQFSKMPTDRTDVMVVDKPVSALVEQLYFAFPVQYPIIDCTGISSNIDVYVEGMKSDFQDIRKGLEKNGLDLVKAERKMRVVVIKDRR